MRTPFICARGSHNGQKEVTLRLDLQRWASTLSANRMRPSRCQDGTPSHLESSPVPLTPAGSGAVGMGDFSSRLKSRVVGKFPQPEEEGREVIEIPFQVTPLGKSSGNCWLHYEGGNALK
jgi:hypothetical protein